MSFSTSDKLFIAQLTTRMAQVILGCTEAILDSPMEECGWTFPDWADYLDMSVHPKCTDDDLVGEFIVNFLHPPPLAQL